MPNAARVAGHRGRHPAKRLPLAFVHEYATGPFPAPQYPVDVSAGITEWLMLGNGPDPTCTTHPDGVGDCTFAGREHYRMAKAAAGSHAEQWETSNELVAEYLRYGHGQDEGANIADLLLHWHKAAVIYAFAPVDHGDPGQVDAAMAAFHGIYAGVNLTGDADQLFGEGEPWTVADGQAPDPEEGHCIVKVAADGVGTDTWVTWGAAQKSTEAWTAACLEEAWVVITHEDAQNAGIDMAALKADIAALHGTPARAVAPGPVGSEADRLLAEFAKVVRTIAASADRDIAEAVAWLHARGL
jgi:hypothetical protein